MCKPGQEIYVTFGNRKYRPIRNLLCLSSFLPTVLWSFVVMNFTLEVNLNLQENVFMDPNGVCSILYRGDVASGHPSEL